ncbi:MAG: hypothetical protein K2J89_04815 [Clostridia bacterium]|nr:hypothetical protein [Clostridia bacterium]
MINKIEMYKVGFGDCFICSDEENRNKMLVDCGSIREVHPNIIEDINLSLARTNNYLMITHFHDDHFNKLEKLDPELKFSEIYLPNFFTRNIIRLEYSILASNNKNLNDDAHVIAINLLKIIPTIARHFKNGVRISFLNKDYGLHKEFIERNGLDKIRILWPEMSYIEQKAKKLNEKIDNIISEENRQLLDDKANKFIEKCSIYVYKREERKNNVDNNYSTQKSDEVTIEIPHKLYKTITEFQNQICLCFDNANSQNDNPVLFLSDINKRGYNAIKNYNDLAPHYSIIKVPHHGTKKYYINNLPDSDSLLIPNDNARKKWDIYNEYFITYQARNIITNSRCCRYLGSCRRSRCIVKKCVRMSDRFCIISV